MAIDFSQPAIPGQEFHAAIFRLFGEMKIVLRMYFGETTYNFGFRSPLRPDL